VPSFYSNLAAVATRLLTDKGQSLTFTRQVTNFFNPATGKDETYETTIAGNGAAFDYHRTEVDGTRIQKGDIRLLFEATTSAPAIGDTTVVDGAAYRVMDVTPTSPGGTVVLYEIQLRK